MKKNLFLFIILIILNVACKSDNFYETKRVILTDKSEYNLGDRILITLKIIPMKESKEIRLYENYKNLELSFSLINEEKGIQNEDWSKRNSDYLPDSNIITIIITQEKPFTKTFVGRIINNNDAVELNFSEINFKVKFKKDRLKDNYIRIHGFCNPIIPEFGASLEEYFEIKDIKINVE